MLTLLLRKDLAETAELVADLYRHRDQVAIHLKEAEHRAEQFLGSPPGLGLSFATGCAVGWMLHHNRPRNLHIGQLANQALPLLSFARQFL